MLIVVVVVVVMVRIIITLLIRSLILLIPSSSSSGSTIVIFNNLTRATENCPELRCEECNNLQLFCSSPGLAEFPGKAVVNDFYKLVDVTYAALTQPVFKKEMFINLKRVSNFRFTHSNLMEIEGFAFSQMKQLLNLELFYNELGIIHDYAFYGLYLTSLELYNNRRLRLKSKAFHGLKVTRMSLANSGIRELQFDTIQPLFNTLEVLMLHGNSLQTLSTEFEPYLASTVKLKVLALGLNPIRCNCRNAWLMRILKFRQINQGQHIELESSLTMYPTCPAFNDKVITSVNETELKCYKPYVQSLTLAVTAACRSLLRCASNDRESKISWSHVLDNGTRIALNSNTYRAQFKYRIIEMGYGKSSLYVDNVASSSSSSSDKLNKFECLVESSIRSAEIRIGGAEGFACLTIGERNELLFIAIGLAVAVACSCLLTFIIYLLVDMLCCSGRGSGGGGVGVNETHSPEAAAAATTSNYTDGCHPPMMLIQSYNGSSDDCAGVGQLLAATTSSAESHPMSRLLPTPPIPPRIGSTIQSDSGYYNTLSLSDTNYLSDYDYPLRRDYYTLYENNITT